MTSVKPVLKRSIKYAVLVAFAAYAAAVSGKYQAVLDGDTLRVGRNSVRLVGIDAPETAQPCVCKGETTPCGRIATEKRAAAIFTAACWGNVLSRKTANGST